MDRLWVWPQSIFVDIVIPLHLDCVQSKEVTPHIPLPLTLHSKISIDLGIQHRHRESHSMTTKVCHSQLFHSGL